MEKYIKWDDLKKVCKNAYISAYGGTNLLSNCLLYKPKKRIKRKRKKT